MGLSTGKQRRCAELLLYRSLLPPSCLHSSKKKPEREMSLFHARIFVHDLLEEFLNWKQRELAKLTDTAQQRHIYGINVNDSLTPPNLTNPFSIKIVLND